MNNCNVSLNMIALASVAIDFYGLFRMLIMRLRYKNTVFTSLGQSIQSNVSGMERLSTASDSHSALFLTRKGCDLEGSMRTVSGCEADPWMLDISTQTV